MKILEIQRLIVEGKAHLKILAELKLTTDSYKELNDECTNSSKIKGYVATIMGIPVYTDKSIRSDRAYFVEVITDSS